jgi:hypothetical protein
MQVFGGLEMARDQNSAHNREHSFATFFSEEILEIVALAERERHTRWFPQYSDIRGWLLHLWRHNVFLLSSLFRSRKFS